MEIILGLAVVAVLVYYFIFKKDKEVVKEALTEAPYKVDQPPVLEPVVVAKLQEAHDAVVASGQPDDAKGLDAAVAAQAAQPELKVISGKGTGKTASKAKAPVKQTKQSVAKPAAKTAAKPVAPKKPATIKAKKTKPKAK